MTGVWKVGTPRLDLSVAALRQVGIVLAFVVTTIGFATTTNSSRALIEIIRFSCLALLVIAALLIAFRESGFNKDVSRALLVAVALTAYGLLLSTMSGSLGVVESTLLRDLVMLLLSIYFIARGGRCVISSAAAKACVGYGLTVLVLTVMTDGIVLSYPPRFVFEYAALMLDGSSVYSQGISKFYGFVAIPAAYIAVVARRITEKTAYGMCAFLFLLLSALGGARGDSAAAALVVACCVFFCGSRESRVLIVAILFALGLVVSSLVDFSDFTIVSRFAALDGGLGAREAFYLDALRLIGAEAKCAYIGCGFGFFQEYYGYSAGSYPHNFLLEMSIVFGVPITFLVLCVALLGLLRDAFSNDSENGVFALLVTFSFLVQLKSGTVLSAWWLMGGLIFYLGRGFDAIEMGGRFRHSSVWPR